MSIIHSGTAFGQWIANRELGEGGFGTVVQVSRSHVAGGGATQAGALKIQKSNSDGANQNFDDEVAMLTRLEGLPTPQLLDSGTTDGHRWFVMSLLKGEPLDKIRVPLPFESWKRMTKDLLGLLTELDKRGIAHRDIWPPNVFRLADGSFTIIDFGVARKPLDQRELAYNRIFNAPEMSATGGNYQSDVYSVGLNLALALFGPGALNKISEGEVLPQYIEGNTSWTDFLDAFLAPGPEDRPSAQELLTEFEMRESGQIPDFAGNYVRSWLDVESAISRLFTLPNGVTVTFTGKTGTELSIQAFTENSRTTIKISVAQTVIEKLSPHNRTGLMKAGFKPAEDLASFETRQPYAPDEALARNTKDALRNLGLRLAGTHVAF
jgi:serine/threonine protein kinase